MQPGWISLVRKTHDKDELTLEELEEHKEKLTVSMIPLNQ